MDLKGINHLNNVWNTMKIFFIRAPFFVSRTGVNELQLEHQLASLCGLVLQKSAATSKNAANRCLNEINSLKSPSLSNVSIGYILNNINSKSTWESLKEYTKAFINVHDIILTKKPEEENYSRCSIKSKIFKSIFIYPGIICACRRLGLTIKKLNAHLDLSGGLS